ncbi:hypothetical protein M3181_20380 [Mesobacillus maritimus]|uniref:hypothetical protein n=1 Tax=Mesobacillus maritimus TaxID=1643336 RepID=UPI0020403D57|nr:hypothetical protein [Mesobacillus maritimus]MCM3671320.1 hypothetical protein [Mesobacillus maritimus]
MKKKKEQSLIGDGMMNGMDVNAVRQAELTKAFHKNIGARALIMMEPYPYFLTGTIEGVENDMVFILTEITNIAELDDELFRIHIDQISVFFIEDGVHKIPKMKDNFS